MYINVINKIKVSLVDVDVSITAVADDSIVSEILLNILPL